MAADNATQDCLLNTDSVLQLTATLGLSTWPSLYSYNHGADRTENSVLCCSLTVGCHRNVFTMSLPSKGRMHLLHYSIILHVTIFMIPCTEVMNEVLKYCRKCQQCKIPCFKDCNGAIRYKVQNYVAIQEEQVSDPHCYSFSCVQQAKDPTFTSIKLIYVRVDCVISFESSYWQKGLWPWCWIKMSFCYKGLIKLLTTRP